MDIDDRNHHSTIQGPCEYIITSPHLEHFRSYIPLFTAAAISRVRGRRGINLNLLLLELATLSRLMICGVIAALALPPHLIVLNTIC